MFLVHLGSYSLESQNRLHFITISVAIPGAAGGVGVLGSDGDTAARANRPAKTTNGIINTIFIFDFLDKPNKIQDYLHLLKI